LTSAPPRTSDELEERLSRPTPAVVEALRQSPGDVIVLGAGGKMGPSLSRMLRRAADEVPGPREVVAVSRWSDTGQRQALEAAGLRTIQADLSTSDGIASVPLAPNVFYMAGQKFGTSESPHRTWVANVAMPYMVAERFRDSKIVAFSTGNVYPLVTATSSGARETDQLSPVGEYAMSCVGRERMFEHASSTHGTLVAIVRLNYAVDLRYGVLVDIAAAVLEGRPVPLRMGFANVIWQGDANAAAIECLQHAGAPPFIVNVTGDDAISVRSVAERFARSMNRTALLEGTEAPDALLSDTSLARAKLAPHTVSTDTLVDWVSDWITRGGHRIGKPTHFEERGGRF
jgi:nucleoside-diphosphate-sugar epimerase